MVITFEQVKFKYADKWILDEVSFSFTEKDKIGIVGSNGSGKTTLLKLILQQEKPHSGEITISGNMRITSLPQDPVFPQNKTLFQCLKDIETKERPLVDYEIESMLNRMKLFDHKQLTNTLSGGEMKRLALAKCLLQESDVLVLDEPTNHLDQEMIIWLEGFLKKMKTGLIMVTHDRYFLERICEKMVEVDASSLYVYEANYTKFLELKEKRLLEEQHSIKKHKALYKRELEWMRRGAQARSTKSKSRIQRFEELASKKFSKQKSFSLSSLKTYLGNKLIEIKDGSKSFAEKILFKNFNFTLNRSDRIGIVGDNGSGKTTLFKIFMGLEELSEGELILGETLKPGYFSQHLLLHDQNIKVIDYIKEESNAIETLDGVLTAKEMLDRFMFEDEEIFSYVKLLSGGQKRRLQLVRVLMSNPNILIFDEPTNDLDLQTLEILELYLENFFGPVLVVSHDRYFLDRVCDSLLVFENQEIVPYQMSFSTFIDQEKKIINEKKAKWVRPKRKITTNQKTRYTVVQTEISELEEDIRVLDEEIKKQGSNYLTIMELITNKEENQNLLDEKMAEFFVLDEIINEES